MKKTMILITMLIISAILTGCTSTSEGAPTNTNTQDSVNDLARCLTANNVTMYGTEWCGHCKAQKKMFGEGFVLVDYVDCDEDRDKCTAAGVKGYPTWVINGENHPGQQPLEKLAFLSGCEIS